MDNVEERLAEEVRKHPNLYEVSSRNYKDHQMSVNSWEQIAQNLGLSVLECKMKWKNVRDRFVRVRKSMSACSGDAGGKKFPLVYHMLSWLSPHIKHRATSSNFPAKASPTPTESSLSPCPLLESPPSAEPSSSSLEPTPSTSSVSLPPQELSNELVSPQLPCPPAGPPPGSPGQSQLPQSSLGSPGQSPLSRVGQKRKRKDNDEYINQRSAELEQLQKRRAEMEERMAASSDELSRFGLVLVDMLRRVASQFRSGCMDNLYMLLREEIKKTEAVAESQP